MRSPSGLLSWAINLECCFVRRDGNYVAHFLASFVYQFDQDFTRVDIVPYSPLIFFLVKQPFLSKRYQAKIRIKNPEERFPSLALNAMSKSDSGLNSFYSLN